MTRDLSAATLNEIPKEQTDDILEFYDVYLDGEILHFVNYVEDVDFWDLAGNSQTYLAVHIKRTPIKHNMDSEIDFVTITIDNVNQGMSNYINNNEFRNRPLILRGCLANLRNSANNAFFMFSGIMDRPGFPDETTFTVEVVQKIGQGSLNVMTGRMQQISCPWNFAGVYCANAGVSPATLKDQKTGTTDSGVAGYIIDSERTEADGYWKNGVIVFTSGANTGEKRAVKNFEAAADKVIFDYSLPNTPQAGDTYTIERRCDQTLDTCQNKFSNQDNFGGMHTLPAELVRT